MLKRPALAFALSLAFALGLAGPALAQTAVTLPANPAPIIDATINDRPVRLEVDPRLPDVLVLSGDAAARLGVRRLPLASAVVSVDGGSSIRGRIARPRIVFGGRASRALAGVFLAPVTSRADGVIGPGALPFEVVTITLNPAPGELREIVFPVRDADDWNVVSRFGGEELRIRFGVVDRETVFNRSAARILDRAGVIRASGDLAETPLILGLSARMQPVQTDETFQGLALAPTLARTGEPLLGMLEPDAIVVEAEGADPPPPSVIVGAAALERCASISVDRRTRRLTLRCAV